MNKKEKEDQSPLHREKKVKRVKTHHVRSNAVTTSPVNIDCFHLEEEASSKLSSEECFVRFQDICKELRKIFQTIYLIKEKKKPEAIRNYVSDVCILIMKLKQLNRLDKHRSKKSRDAVNEGKQKVDSLNLQYQNLLYEVTHLQKEVTKCLEFRSRDEEIELIPVEQFFAEAPKEISRPDVTKQDTHELTVARLEWELEQRKRLAVKLEEAEVTKEECKRNIRKLKECLQNIQPTLQSILEATEPLQSKLGMPLQATRLKHRTAKFLPKPLYTLYIEICAYKEACDKKISISIEGNVDDAKVLQMKLEDIVDDSGESDQEENFIVKRHRHSVSVRPEESHKDILSKHPLSVCITVSCNGSKLYIEFYYLFHLNIVTVTVKNLLPHVSTIFSWDLLNPNTLLKCLFTDDDEGKMSPNPANKYLLSKTEYDDTPFSNEKSGLPYHWVQEISGLHFVSSNDLDIPEQNSSTRVSYIENVITAIRARVNARISLSEQMSNLENGAKIPSEIAHIYPSNILSQLKSWTTASWEEIMKHPKYEELLELGAIRKEGVVFKAIVERGSAVLTSLVAIPPDYPFKSPIFFLFLLWKIASTSATNGALRELEEEVNVHCVETVLPNHCNELLMYQMYHLLACFDIFLETEHSEESLEGPCEFLREKVVTRIYRGRSHSRPYRYLSSKGIFTH